MRKLDNKLTKTIGDDVSDNLQEETYIGLKQKLIKEYRKKTSEELENEQLFLQYQLERLNDEKLISEAAVNVSNNFFSFVAIAVSIESLIISAGGSIIPDSLNDLIGIIVLFTVLAIIIILALYGRKELRNAKKNTSRFLYELKLDCIKEVLDTRQMKYNRAQHKRRRRHKVRLKLKSKQE